MSTLILIMFMHFVSDFILQTDTMAKNKSKNIECLLAHVLVYSIPFLCFGLKFTVINAGLHFLIDFFTSRASGYFYKKGEIHNFFVIIGFDQFLHFCCLYISALELGII